MASNRIKGITIEIDGNTTPLTKSLQSVDKSLKDTQAQLKDVNKLLKMDPGNVELLRQKQNLLGEAVAKTKERQQELIKALEQAKQGGDTEENRRQQDLLQRELIETTQELKGLEDEYKRCSPTLQSISVKTGKLAEQTKGLSTAAGVAGASMLAMAYKAGQNADELLTMSNVTGFSVKELQKLQYASDFVDVSYETMTSSVTKLTKQMGAGSEAFKKLGVNIYNVDGTLQNNIEIWFETLDALSQVENETERDTLAMEIFGKSAAEMAGIIDDGGEALWNLGQEAEAAGLIMGEDAVEQAGKFNDALDKIKTTAVQSFMQAGATLAETLLPLLEKLVEWVTKVLTWFGNLDGTTQKIILTILALVAALSPTLTLISKITAALPLLKAAFAAMSGPVGIVVAAIAALIAIGVALYKNWDVVKAKATQLWTSLKATFQKIGEAIMKPIEKAKEFVKGVIEKIKSFFQFKVELPKIKLPHFGIQPAGWKLGDLLKGSIPKLGISWYKRAMDKGVVLQSPTIFGMQNGQLLAGGEAGPEVVVGAQSLMSMIRSATSGTGGVSVSVVVNGNVDDYDELAETIGQKLQQQMAREQKVFA